WMGEGDVADGLSVRRFVDAGNGDLRRAGAVRRLDDEDEVGEFDIKRVAVARDALDEPDAVGEAEDRITRRRRLGEPGRDGEALVGGRAELDADRAGARGLAVALLDHAGG